MYAQLGNIIFDGLFTFSSMSRTETARYAEIALLDGKAVLQRTGDELTTVSLSFNLHKAFTEPRDAIQQFRDYRESGEVVELVDGTGASYGFYVVVTVTTTPIRMASADGRLDHANLTVSLSESYDPNRVSSEIQNLKSKAVAIEENGATPVPISTPEPVPAAFVVVEFQAAKSNVTYAVSDIEDAQNDAARRDSLLQKAAEKAKKAKSSAEKAIAKIQDTQTLAATAPNLESDLAAMVGNLDQLVLAAESGNLANATTSASATVSSMGAVDNSIGPLKQAVILRKG